MARSTGRVSAAPTTIIFENGEEIQFHPLTDKDIGEIDEWLQARVMENARRSLGSDATPAEREETLRIAATASISVSIMSRQGAQMIGTLPGMVHLTWVSARKSHPTLTKEHLASLLLNPENLERVNAAFDKVNSVPKANPSGNPKRVKRQKRKR